MRYWLWAAQPAHFATFAQTGTFAVRRQGRPALARMRAGDRIVAVVTQGGGIAGLFEAVGAPFEDATSLLLDKPTPHRIRVRRLAELPEDDWIPVGPLLDDLTVLHDYPQFATLPERFAAVVRRIVHEVPAVDGKVLEFTIHARQAAPLGPILDFVHRFVRAPGDEDAPLRLREPSSAYVVPASGDFDRAAALEALLARLAALGFDYAPHEVAAYVTALRTKPFVLLAGPTGVGKSALPRLVAEATDSAHTLIPVQPEWADAAETLGYLDLAGRFRPGSLLRAARRAAEAPQRHHVAVLDEMNLARPEHYLATVLSRLEVRGFELGAAQSGTMSSSRSSSLQSSALIDLEGVPEPWAHVPLPTNLGLVGTVNIDESTVPFSRKVLDRAFVLDLGTQPLSNWQPVAAPLPPPAAWPAGAWQPRANRLADLSALTQAEQSSIEQAVECLAEADAILRPAGFAVGYRSRDEIALFALHADDLRDVFRLGDGSAVDPLDVALSAKLLPRLAGSSRAFADALAALLGWAVECPAGDSLRPAAEDYVERHVDAGRPQRYDGARFPFTAARLTRMAERLASEGYAAFWD